MRTRTCTIAMAVVVGALVAPTGAAVAAPPPPSAGIYTVQEGDFLYGIASRAGVSIDALLRSNNLKLTSIIITGQKLTIPAGGKVPAPLAPVTRSTTATVLGRTITAPVAPVVPATVAPAPAPVASGQTYTVQAGDTLIGIAFRFAVSPDALMTLNKLNLKSIIIVGQKLALPAGAKQLPASTGNAKIDLVIAAAKAQIGKPYKFGFAGPDFFDCSGLVRYAFARIGMDLLHHTVLQKNSFPAVAVADLRPGDLVFFHDDFSHEGLWLGNNLMIEAPAPGMNVQISWVPTDRITGAVRPIA